MSLGMESADLAACADCGETVSPLVERVYLFGTESVLCMECAVRRGGVYDGADDRWLPEPSVDDLLEASERLN